MPFSAGTMVSGLELPLHLGLPMSSVSGVTVIAHTAFGRNLADKTNGISIGKLYHMGNVENNNVRLDINSLASHTFVTGSTGSGKSNTIYQMLGELKNKRVKFLVIEPAKGEYKNVFGHDDDVSVYGTNPNFTEMLRINPFSFPEEIHVYEHLDRLIEIFNACWPMYAAMPAVLKDAVERAYIDCGWDMKLSQNSTGYRIFPTFVDVLDKISEVMEESKYSADSKGDYIGALSTRVRSMTTGINSLMFTHNELSYEKLFDENVIVDISRIGSVETKAFIMGILIMKQQEYRMSKALHGNEDLKHVTILEEAHTLLKRTSTEQATEGANLIGKSVEMIANAIAEMRTYGEGFIITDQSPGLLDMSVILNTNTKIILRLPEYSDRELVGKAASLNDDQIIELAKLERGVAAVYQNDWIEPVLCKVDKFSAPDEEQTWKSQKYELATDNAELTNEIMRVMLNHEPIKNKDEFRDKLDRVNIRSAVKKSLLEYVENDDGEGFALSKISDKFFNSAEIMVLAKTCKTVEDWQQIAIDNMIPSVKDYTHTEVQLLLLLILQAEAYKSIENKNVFHSYMEYLQNSRRMI